MNAPAHQHQPVLSLVDETVGYRGRVVLHNVTLDIHAEEKIAVIGPSGSGKTSLLKKLYNLKPQHCTFIHQHYSLVPQLSVFHNIYIGRLDHHSSLYNLLTLVRPASERRKEISAIVGDLGLTEKLWNKVGELSGGQQQRVGIGRALYRGGDIVMADEPVSSLDALQGREIIKLITSLGKTVVSALHNVEMSREFFDRIVGLHGAGILFDLPASLVTDRHLEELYS